MKLLILILLLTSVFAENQIEFLNNKVFKKLSLSEQKIIAKYYFDIKLADSEFFNLSKKEQKSIYNNFYIKSANLETTNKWSMLYTNSKLGSCKVSSEYIEGAKLTYIYLIVDSKDVNYGVNEKVDKFQLFNSTIIEFIPNVIKLNKCTLLTNGKEKNFDGYWTLDGELQCEEIPNKLLEGNNTTLKLMKTNGDIIYVPFKSNDSFIEKAKKCETSIQEQINILNKVILNNEFVSSKNKNNPNWIKIPSNKKETRLINGTWVKIPSAAKYVNSVYIWSENSKKLTFKEIIERVGYDYNSMKKEGYNDKEILEKIKAKIFVNNK